MTQTPTASPGCAVKRVGFARGDGPGEASGDAATLRAAGCEKTYVPTSSIEVDAVWASCLAALNRPTVLVIPSFRHLVPLRDRIEELAAREIAVVVLDRSPHPVPGRVFATLITTLHAQRGARSRVAVDAARAAGRVPGRRTLLTLEMEDRLELLLRQGATVSAAASAVGLSEMTVYRWLRRQRTPG